MFFEVKTVAQRFEQAVQRANPSEESTKLASQRSKAVRLLLKPIAEKIFLSGSFARGTATNPIHDVDILMVIKGSGHTVRSAMKVLVKHLEEHCHSLECCEFRLQQHSVGIIWDKGPSVDVVPLRPLEGGAGYQIGSRTLDGWKATYPEHALAALQRANQKCNRLIPLIKLLKMWNVTLGKPLKSFHLELMCYSSDDFVTLLGKAKNDRHRMRDLLMHLYIALDEKIVPPGGGTPIIVSNPKERMGIRDFMFAAMKVANEAVLAEDYGNERLAHGLWSQLLRPLY